MAGNGEQAGTCTGSNMKCQSDGSCKVCEVKNSGTGIHTGCDDLNPICVGGTSCHCNSAASVTCDGKHSICHSTDSTYPYSGGTCKCGNNDACQTGSAAPYCFVSEGAEATSGTCEAGKVVSQKNLISVPNMFVVCILIMYLFSPIQYSAR